MTSLGWFCFWIGLLAWSLSGLSSVYLLRYLAELWCISLRSVLQRSSSSESHWDSWEHTCTRSFHLGTVFWILCSFYQYWIMVQYARLGLITVSRCNNGRAKIFEHCHAMYLHVQSYFEFSTLRWKRRLTMGFTAAPSLFNIKNI